jgi:LacI family transcriptional regulator
MPKPRRIAMMLELDWPYKRHAAVFAGAQQYVQERDWECIIDEYADDTLATHRTKTVPYDGIIARATTKLARHAARLNVPLVNVWFSSPTWREVPGVFTDFAAMGRLCAEHLLARGFSCFVALMLNHDRGQVAEMKAFVDTLAEAGYPCATKKIPLDPSTSLQKWRETTSAVDEFMASWELPAGVLVGSERHGRQLVQMCRNRGWRVPEDIAIIAGQNEETLCEHLRPTLTSVEVGYERIGYEAARLLDRLMGKEVPPAEPILLPPQGLVVRESTDFFAVGDPLMAAALQFIAAKSHQELSPRDVARAVSTETRTLQRRFRKHLDRSIAAEIRRVRTERAKRELTQGKRSIKEIARSVGFGESMRMYEVFCRELGVTPSQYRRQRQTARVV